MGIDETAHPEAAQAFGSLAEIAQAKPQAWALGAFGLLMIAVRMSRAGTR